MTENKRFMKEVSDGYWSVKDNKSNTNLTNPYMIINEMNKLNDLNENLRIELKADAKNYQRFSEILSFADDLICSNLSKHYKRQWRKFCESRDVYDW